MTPLTAEKIAEMERLPVKWRARMRLDESQVQWMRQKTYEQCADELEDMLAPILSLAKRVAGAPVAVADMLGSAYLNFELPDEEAAALHGKHVALVEIVGGEEGNGD